MGLGIRIHSATEAASALKQVWRTHRGQVDNFRKLASGERVTIAADGTAGLAISEKLRARADSLQVAIRNVEEGTNLVRTASGAFSEAATVLSRMRELAVQASSEVLHSSDRALADTEFLGLRAELDRIGATTNYNGLALTTLTPGTVDVQVGIGAGASDNRLTVTLHGATANNFGVGGQDLSSVAQARLSISRVDSGLSFLSTFRANLGSFETRLSSIRHNLQSSFENSVASESAIRDADFAQETARLTRGQILAQAGVAILSQASFSKQTALSLIQ